MKKLLFAVIVLIVFIPISANAARGFKFDENCMTNSMVAGDTRTCTLYGAYTGTTTDTSLTFSYTALGNFTTITSIEASGAFTISSNNGSTVTLTAPSAQSGNFEVLKVTYTVSAGYVPGSDCGVRFLLTTGNIPVCNPKVECCEGDTYPNNPLCPPPANPVCEVKDGKYYGKSGVEVTYEVYHDQCEVENPDTGSFIPYLTIGLIGAATLGIYIYSKNKNKLHRI